jgi:RNA polymerase sigma-70 factor (ECF subfamily)
LCAKVDTPQPAHGLQPIVSAKSIKLVDPTVSDRFGSQAVLRDADLLEAHRRRDYAAVLDGLMRRYRQKVVNLSFSLVREPALAQDLAQIAFLKLWLALPQFDGRAALSTWLYAIVRNTCLSALRARGRSPTVACVASDEVCDDSPAHDAMTVAEAEHDLARLLDDLPEPYRRVVTLFYLEERSCESVADLLGMPEGTVKSLLFRARKRLAARARTLDARSDRHRGVVNGS